MRIAASPTRSNVALALLLALLALACAASSARAESWGQVTRFPLTTGKEPGQINESGLVRFAAGSDGSYYVLTETRGSHELVLQRFFEGAMQAKAVLKGEEEVKGGTEGEDAILAVDPSRNRVYVLLVYERPEPTEAEENKGLFPLDSEMPAAGSLYAFEYDGTKELVKKSKLGRKELKGEADGPKEPLLDPRGIGVDPATGDLAISGNQDEESNEKVLHGAQKQCRAAAQFVTVKSVESGTKKGQIESLSLGARYVDSAGKTLFGQTGCGEEEEEEAIGQAPASPVFAPDGALLAFSEEEVAGPEGVIWQLAPAGADTHAPGEVSTTPKELFVAESLPAVEPETGDEEPASVMSLVPESATDGTIYLSGDYVNRQPAPAVLHYSHPGGGEPSITEIGWTAGGSVEPGTQRPEPCDLHKGPTGKPIMLGGLSGSKRGYLALTYYKEFEHEVERKRAEVVKFGEGGSTTGCPKAPATTPTQSYHSEPTHEAPAGTPLEITSVLGTIEDAGKTIHPAAGAKSVTWTVKLTPPSGSSEEKHYETKYEYNGLHEEEPNYGIVLKLKQTFTQVGVYEITDEVHTDDLAGEVARSAADELIVTAGKFVVKAGVPEPPIVEAHEQEALLTARAEVPGETKPELKVEKVVWEFGDGTKAEEIVPQELPDPATLQIKHAFNRCGESTKCKIKVTVRAETAEGLPLEEGSSQAEITVKESKAEEEKRHEEEAAAKKRAEEKRAEEKRAEEEAAAKKHAEEEAAAKASATKHAEEEAAAKRRVEEEAAAKRRAEEEAAKGGVGGYVASFAGSSLRVSSSGATSVRITCPSGGSCSGTLTLRTLTAVAASRKRHSKHSKKKVLTLASGAFSLPGGSRSVTLRLDSKARALLHRSHGVLRAKLTILSRGVGGQKNSVGTRVVTLREVVKKKKSRKH